MSATIPVPAAAEFVRAVCQRGAATVVTEDEFVEVDLQVLGRDAAVRLALARRVRLSGLRRWRGWR
jgi:hypothetical protein